MKRRQKFVLHTWIFVIGYKVRNVWTNSQKMSETKLARRSVAISSFLTAVRRSISSLLTMDLPSAPRTSSTRIFKPDDLRAETTVRHSMITKPGQNMPNWRDEPISELGTVLTFGVFKNVSLFFFYSIYAYGTCPLFWSNWRFTIKFSFINECKSFGAVMLSESYFCANK